MYIENDDLPTMVILLGSTPSSCACCRKCLVAATQSLKGAGKMSSGASLYLNNNFNIGKVKKTTMSVNNTRLTSI